MIQHYVRESLYEAYNPLQYANLAGQANGALNSFGGKVKGFFNPKWKARKQRQEKLFGNAGTGYGNRHNFTKDMEDSITIGNGTNYDTDYWKNSYKGHQKDSNYDTYNSTNNPYNIERTQYNYGDYMKGIPNHRGKEDGETMTSNEFRNKYAEEMGDNYYDDGYSDFVSRNRRLNNAYMNGMKGNKFVKGGGTTGTQSQYFRNLGKK